MDLPELIQTGINFSHFISDQDFIISKENNVLFHKDGISYLNIFLHHKLKRGLHNISFMLVLITNKCITTMWVVEKFLRRKLLNNKKKRANILLFGGRI